ncbi:WcaG Nucleoside-diphosphate-sugar epimerases [uncultured Caudovirales phage]|uniref:WcaG Nucleoside-diphosphate-sugar epimerases n=1 Tax=uncultured Caudovirales phage TaxID=2100421 RepID=A0A6J5TCU5_9CAUD|nr:WcaG Nucleoside-diphosphate-sugar epimerases [uncultured Caudovirales phage]CAB5219626.1 WcaG Nucleoside-diphosphate-sugar epimerases [uncultured Caudovirales phage]
MKILITGHKGFVGKYFVKKYEGHDITGIDLADGVDVRDFFKTNREHYDLVIHLAAIVGGRATIEGNPLSVATDLAIDSDFFNWALITKPGRIVYFSSSAAYPIMYQQDNNWFPLSEDMIDLDNVGNPDLTYGWSKLTGEYLAKFVQEAGIPVHIFRPFSGYGTDQSLDYPFPSYIKRAKDRMDPFDIWGDGEQSRDFIHMSDVVDAVAEAIRLDIQGPINLGMGRRTTFNELAKIVTEIEGYSPEFNHLPAAPVGVVNRIADPTKMLSFYTPKITLEEGIERALKGIV